MWEQIRSNQRRTAILVVGMAAVLFGLGYALTSYYLKNGVIGVALAFILWMILSLVSYFGGNKIFLGLSRARKIKKEDCPRLFNVVEEMTIASGLGKMPDIYIIDDAAPNAFATGRDPDHAAVAVTSGLLNMLDRDELQGVMAHEIGHIQNRDILLMLMVGVMMGTIVILADVGLRSMLWGGRSRRRTSSKEGGQGEAIILVVALILMILAPIIAQLIYFSISRKREYLADASSALYTRYPLGLASALEKLSGSPATLASANRATASMYIINPLKARGARASDITSTHPRTSERVRILRSMAGGASFLAYEQAYRGVKGKGGIIPPTTAAQSKPVSQRGASKKKEKKKDRVREVTDLLWKLNQYLFIACVCGTRLKIPPGFAAASVSCPHCGKVHSVPKAPKAGGAEKEKADAA